jgi:hypothetical protein
MTNAHNTPVVSTTSTITQGDQRKKFVMKAAGAACIVAVLGIAVAACSSSSTTTRVASLAGHGSAAGTSRTLSQAQVDQAEIDFARCLRSHGVNEPDPHHVPGKSGLVVQVPPSGPATNAALSACSHILPPASGEAQQRREADLPALTRYAQCMRGHDIALLDPDPQTGSLNLGNVPGITSDFGRHTPQFRSADAACRHLLPADVHDDGTGP